MRTIFFFLIIYYLLSANIYAQTDKCGTVQYQEKHRKDGRLLNENFEKWLLEKTIEQKLSSKSSIFRNSILQIPVVVHIIHNGESLNQGSNIPDVQVINQIETLNKDFRRLNEDAVKTPPAYKDVAADIGVEFVLAKQDPDGAPTSGITRTKGSKKEWTIDDDEVLKSISYWPSDKYLNIWVANLGSDILGYSQFPLSDQLEGLESASDNALTDGIVITYRFFGSGGNASNLSKGRTATHEIGHFLGLRHIWGDAPTGTNGCYYDDYCEDTPNTSKSYSSCTNADSLKACNGVRPMVENYMDYTIDSCMNIFTSNQKERMLVILEHSPGRKTLVTSKALEEPEVFSNDIALKGIISPGAIVCNGNIVPQILIRNMGSAIATTLDLSVQINNEAATTYKHDLSLASYDTQTITLPEIGSQFLRNNLMSAWVSGINNTTDENHSNDTVKTAFTVPANAVLPIQERFSTFPENWDLENYDDGISWEIKEVQMGNSTLEKVAYINFYSYDDREAYDIMLTPTFDLVDADSAKLSFKVAYAYQSGGANNDGLGVIISRDCGITLDAENDLLYLKSGRTLSTTTSRATSFTPSLASEWREEALDLSSYLGLSNLRVAFIALNENGNNLYLDDVEVMRYNITAIDNQNSLANLKVFPNPSEGIVSISLSKGGNEKVNLKIYNIIGKLVKAIDDAVLANDILEVDLSSFEKGVYMIHIKGQSFETAKKIILY